MPVLKNARHERFAQELAKGKTADEAYSEAGFKPNRHNASRLKTNEHISARVAEIQEKTAKKVEVTVEKVLAGLMREADRTGEGSSHSARVTAWATLGKHLGMFADKVQVTGHDGGAVAHTHVHEVINRIVDPKQG